LFFVPQLAATIIPKPITILLLVVFSCLLLERGSAPSKQEKTTKQQKPTIDTSIVGFCCFVYKQLRI